MPQSIVLTNEPYDFEEDYNKQVLNSMVFRQFNDLISIDRLFEK